MTIADAGDHMMADGQELNRQGFLASRNTAEIGDWYEALSNFMATDDSSPLLKTRSFALYSPRQTISDFLVRYELFKMVKDIPGAFLEFGVYNGQGLLSWANFSAIQEPYHVTREIYGFDTFAGFSGVGERDKSDHPDVVRDGGYSIASYERISRAIELFDQNRPIGHVKKIFLVPGDVKQTLRPFLASNPHVVPALIYLDMDIYEPTRFVIEELLDRMPKGGIVAFDEFAHRSYPGETTALMDVLPMKDIKLQRVPFCSRIAFFIR